ncbi:hypothetical protein ACFQ61_09885 [Streptomyces sp. NPDC056500]|uniref:hypothetical protein n=1 Tax=Streptomyces sp. NPDC056500 TaxID=3345840 RepID=UPI0036C7F436
MTAEVQPPAQTAPAAPCPHGHGVLLGLVVGIAVLVVLMFISSTAYLTYQHPRLAAPLGVGGVVATVLVMLVPLLYRRR